VQWASLLHQCTSSLSCALSAAGALHSNWMRRNSVGRCSSMSDIHVMSSKLHRYFAHGDPCVSFDSTIIFVLILDVFDSCVIWEGNRDRTVKAAVLERVETTGML
jgi:hypothetical protein